MENNYFIANEIMTITLPKTLDDSMQLTFLQVAKKRACKKIVLDLRLYEVVTTDDIKKIEAFVKLFKLNSCEAVVCNINIESASILFHFIEDVNFQTALDIESAVNVLENR